MIFKNTSQPARNLSASEDGINFIALYEKFVPSVYADQAGYPTIGYGHKLLPGESYPDGISQDDALQLLRRDVGVAEATVQTNVIVDLTQPQFDAMTSLTYNIGARNFEKSSLLRLLNLGDYNAAADRFLDWNKERNGGQLIVSQGLVNRRNAERNLFLTGVYS